MFIKLYAIHGALGREKQPVYVDHKLNGEIIEEFEAYIPDEFEPYESVSGAIIVNLPGLGTIELNRVLRTGKDDEPYIFWHDGNNRHKYNINTRKV